MISNAITVEVIKSEKDLQAAYGIRRKVFIEEQGVTEDEEFDGLDEKATHYIVKIAGICVGTLRLRKLSDSEAKIERLCVLKDYRGHGAGRKIMEKVLKTIKNDGINIVHLYGQTHAVGFYQSFGFKVYDDEFIDARIPHRKLKLDLQEKDI